MSKDSATLVLRLAAPMQSWGGNTPFNRRGTEGEPTKSGVVGLLAAAAGRRRGEEIADLLGLQLGVRADQAGTLLRDYHTVSNYTGAALPQAGVNAKGVQKPTSPAKHTAVTQRFYLQDAVFTAAVAGAPAVVAMLAEAVTSPRFPLALGRRSCPPAGQLLIGVFDGGVDEALAAVPWQISDHAKKRYQRENGNTATVTLLATVEDPAGDSTAWDVPSTFAFGRREFTPRTIRHTQYTVPTGLATPTAAAASAPLSTGTENHDPFELLG